MTKILLCSVRPDEKAAIEEFAQNHEVELICHPGPVEEARHLITPELDGIVIQQMKKVDADIYSLLEECGLKQLSTRTAGYDVIDLEACSRHGLIATNVPQYSPRSVAEFALMHIFRMLRKMPELEKRVAQRNFSWKDMQAKEIHTACIGIIGVGRIGGALAQLLHALGAEVLGYDLVEHEEMKEYLSYVSKEELLRRSDVVSLHVDLNPTSIGLISKEDLALMPSHACLVNASRGPVVVTADLIEALKTGEIAAAALDTVEGEELICNRDHSAGEMPEGHIKELMELDNASYSPHIAFFTNVAVKNMIDTALEDVLSILEGKGSEHALNELK